MLTRIRRAWGQRIARFWCFTREKILAAVAPIGVTMWGIEGNAEAGETIGRTIINFSDALIGFVAVAAVVAMIVGGFMFIASMGNERNIETAKKIMLYSIVGIAVALFAKLIVSFAVSRLAPPA
ncbi:hypothetical protein V3F56_03080 [Moorellaceae bacterium AZ2]